MSPRQSPRKTQIVPKNAFEAAYLESTNFTQHSSAAEVYVHEVTMATAIDDLEKYKLQQLFNPFKRVRVTRTVQHALPGRDDLQTDTVEREELVPMTAEEAEEHFRQVYEELTGITLVSPRPTIKKKSKTSKTKKKAPTKK